MAEDVNDFLWGVATSGYQSEGGYNGLRQPQNNWSLAEHDGRAARTGVGVDFWNRYAGDLALSRGLGLNAFRLSIEWARVQPSAALPLVPSDHAEPPPFDEAALDHYAEILGEVRAQGLRPIVTLFHFTHPAWLGANPWLDAERTLPLFERYVRHMVIGLVTRLKGKPSPVAPPDFFITVNEPNILATNQYLTHVFPGAERGHGVPDLVRAFLNLHRLHLVAARVLRQVYTDHGLPAPRVAVNHYVSDLYWLDEAVVRLLHAPALGVARGELRDYLVEGARDFVASFVQSGLPGARMGPRATLAGWLKKRQHEVAAEWLDSPEFNAVANEVYEAGPELCPDVVAFDYYDPFVAHLVRLPDWSDIEYSRTRPWLHWLFEPVSSKWWDWRACPLGLEFFARRRAQFGRPLLVAENGMAMRQDEDGKPHSRRDHLTRSEYLREHVRRVVALRREGVPLMGYLHWSLTDNYEWGTYAARFGLYAIDYRNGRERLPTDQWGDNSAQTYAAEIKRARPLLARRVVSPAAGP